MKIIHNIKEFFWTLFWNINKAVPGDEIEIEYKSDGFCIRKKIEAIDKLDNGMSVWFYGENQPTFIPYEHNDYYIDKIANYD